MTNTPATPVREPKAHGEGGPKDGQQVGQKCEHAKLVATAEAAEPSEHERKANDFKAVAVVSATCHQVGIRFATTPKRHVSENAPMKHFPAKGTRSASKSARKRIRRPAITLVRQLTTNEGESGNPHSEQKVALLSFSVWQCRHFFMKRCYAANVPQQRPRATGVVCKQSGIAGSAACVRRVFHPAIYLTACGCSNVSRSPLLVP